MSDPAFMIRVPGSTANLGPGFDSIGLAVNRYLDLFVSPAEQWSFHGEGELADLPPLEKNLIYRVAQRVANEEGKPLSPCRVAMKTNIPLAKGLGSSAAAIVAAIELANRLAGLNLSQEEKLRYASRIEGHPDNVSPSLLGGLVVGSHTDEWTEVIQCGVPPIDLVLMVPRKPLLTKKARDILPETLSFKQAVKASSISNVLIAAILNHDWETAGRMMKRDLFHHPYRTRLIPELARILDEQDRFSAYGAALSGAGPSIMWFAAPGNGKMLIEELSQHYPQYRLEQLQPEPQGARIHSSSIYV